MANYKLLAPALIYAFVFGSLGALPFGFYLAPTLFGAFLLGALPFRFKPMNLTVFFGFSLAAMLLLAVFMGGGILPSAKIFGHIALYSSLFLAIAAAVYDQKR